jgi:hypothetical protein
MTDDISTDLEDWFTTEDDIKPALTPEEWAENLNYWQEPGNPRRMHSEFGDEPDPEWEHALAALALHGQPFGFTHDMADALRRAIGRRVEWMQPIDDDTLLLQAIADRIAALLPPREE